jgi:phage tail sheath protein FI
MGFQVSPGVKVSEIDLTTVVPAVSTTEGAIAGVFNWGTVEERVLIDSEASLVARFGKPNNNTFETFFTAANFLAYGNALYVTRVIDANSRNAVATGATAVAIKNEDDFENGTYAEAALTFAGKYPGTLGNSIKVSVCDTANAFSEALANTITIGVGSTTANTTDDESTLITVGDIIPVGNSSIGVQDMKVSAVNTSVITFTSKYTLSTDFTGNTTRKWEYYNNVNGAPGTTPWTTTKGGSSDEIHVVVTDEDGSITGTAGQVVEVFESLSRATDAKSPDGSYIHYKTAINNRSAYIYAVNHRGGASYVNTAVNVTALSTSAPLTTSLQGGVDSVSESAISLADLAKGYDLYKDGADVDVSMILQGKATAGTNQTGLANYIIDNICEVRKDCVAFISPDRADVINNAGDEATDSIAFRNSLTASSYAVLDSGYKYQYDKYNDVYRYVPFNGDVAGLAVRTDDLRDPWFSPAGYNRGIIKNIVKLPYNPRQADRDVLYKADINPIVNFPGQGTVLFGDKTLLGKPSAFDRINVRRLFIVLEKAIATAAKFSLFELNDEFTRAQFKNLVEPFLRDVQGRRGIYDFAVICDGTNNTGEVIDRNEFIADIYIKPAKSINFIQLNFVAVRTGVEFSEIIGKF